MTADIFGSGEHRDIDPGSKRGEEHRRRPSVVEERSNSPPTTHLAHAGYVLDFHREGPGALQQDKPCIGANQLIDAGPDERIIVTGCNSEPL